MMRNIRLNLNALGMTTKWNQTKISNLRKQIHKKIRRKNNKNRS